MNKTQKVGIAGVVIAVAFVVGLRVGIAQPAAPTETKGVNVKVLEAIDLRSPVSCDGGTSATAAHHHRRSGWRFWGSRP